MIGDVRENGIMLDPFSGGVSPAPQHTFSI